MKWLQALLLLFTSPIRIYPTSPLFFFPDLLGQKMEWFFYLGWLPVNRFVKYRADADVAISVLDRNSIQKGKLPGINTDSLIRKEQQQQTVKHLPFSSWKKKAGRSLYSKFQLD